MKNKTLEDARQKARILLDRNLATHQYFTEVLKPSINEWSEPFRDETYFDPSWMSSTYAVRTIDRYFSQMAEEEYYYKECAINARSPQNEADAYEKQFLRKLQSNPQLVEQSAVREIDQTLQYTILRRGETIQQSCLLCHSEPQAAPKEIVSLYGNTRSFHREMGEVVSAISIRIPLDKAYAQVETFTQRLTLFMIAILFLLFVAQYMLSRYLFFQPLQRMQDKSREIANDQNRIGETIELTQGREWINLSSAFNQMSINLRQQIDRQEETIAERTRNILEVNQKLQNEIEERKRIEKEQEKLIEELQTAMQNVKLLSGLIPICSSCKKIRDDDGYWNQIEEYIRDHSEAEFTHGLCETCAKKYFSDGDLDFDD